MEPGIVESAHHLRTQDERQAAIDLGVDKSTVTGGGARFIPGAWTELHGGPRPGRPPSILLARSRA